MEEVEVEIILPTPPDVDRLAEGLAEHLGLKLTRRGMTSTFDRMVDTEDMALLSQDHSLRVRQKLDNMYSGQEFRLTYKFPLREHDRLFIRAENKLKLADPDYECVLRMLSNITSGVSSHHLETLLHIHELAHELDFGEKGRALRVSYDSCSYSLPDKPNQSIAEHVIEIESHGLPDEMVLTASDWVTTEFGGREAARCKYSRGLQLLGKL